MYECISIANLDTTNYVMSANTRLMSAYSEVNHGGATYQNYWGRQWRIQGE